MTPTALIAEDEAPQRAELVALLAVLWPELSIASECADGLSAREALKMRPTVAFLDIRMPGMSGVEVAKGAGQTHVVFVTAYDQFAVQAFEDGAADYLLKPVQRDRLAATVQRLKARIAAGQRADLAGLLATLQPGGERLKWISATVRGGVRMISVEGVLFFQSEDKLTRVVTADGEAHIRTPIKALIEKLDPDVFWQVHRGAVARVSAIRKVTRDEDGRLRLTIAGRAETLPVSAAFAARFKGM